MSTVVKKSVSVPDIIWTAAEAEAEASHTTVSALVAEGLQYLLAIRAGQHAARDWEAEHGAFSPEEIAEADAALDAAGVTAGMSGLTYDSGALIAAERNDRRMWLIHARALARGVQPTVPAAALAEVYRSGRQANLERLLTGCQVDPLDRERARATGLLLSRCAVSPGAVDASVAECALRRGDAVVTGNGTHLAALADGAGRKLAIIAI